MANVYALYLYDAEEQGARFPMSKRRWGKSWMIGDILRRKWAIRCIG